MKPIYLDYNATTPVDPEVAEAMLPYLTEHFGNPSSSHWYGKQASKAVETARGQVAELINAATDEIIFTGGGSEANNLAIKGYAAASREKGNHIITSSIEHPAVLEVCKDLETRGYRITHLLVNEFGIINLHDLEKAIIPGTILITIMHANNEVGTIQPVSAIGRIARDKNIAFHTDAAQSVGKIPVDINDLQVDMLSIAGHKLYAPKGVGALYVRRGTNLHKQIHGAAQEFNLRAGTENVPEIVGLGKACEIMKRDKQKNMRHMLQCREQLYKGLKAGIQNIKLNGHTEKRLPNTLNTSFPGVKASTILSSMTDVAASAGAACHSDHIDISHVLKAMNLSPEIAMGTIRFSVGKTTTHDDIEKAVNIIVNTVNQLSGKSIKH
ncbi:cysteine desulfurase [candidate division KSB1 bacterium]|nr:cysteine desulfurase [candidate division KSB1 bacterium]